MHNWSIRRQKKTKIIIKFHFILFVFLSLNFVDKKNLNYSLPVIGSCCRGAPVEEEEQDRPECEAEHLPPLTGPARHLAKLLFTAARPPGNNVYPGKFKTLWKFDRSKYKNKVVIRMFWQTNIRRTFICNCI